MVTRNLVAAPGGNCIIILPVVNNVTIDLGGHTIRGDDSESTAGIVGDGGHEIIIHNGRIRDFAVGIDLGNSTRVTLARLTVTSNLSDGIRTGGSTVMTNTAATDNGGDGIFIDGCCNTLRNVTASRNGGDGIDVNQCCTAVTRTEVRDNGGDGIDLAGGCNFVTHVEARRNGETGITRGDCCNVVSHARARRNDGDGIVLVGGLVADSVADRSEEAGISILKAEDGWNAVLDSTARGQRLRGDLRPG